MTTSHPAAHALFRIEEEQAKRTVEEKVIELGLRIPLVKIREPKESFFSRKLLSSSGAAAPRSSPDSNRASTNLTNHSAMIKVFTAQPVTVPELRTLSPEDYEEVYQSEVQTGPSPVFATLLLLPLEREDGFAGAQGTVRPIRFELWIGVRRATPDHMQASRTMSVRLLLEELGGARAGSQWAPLILEPDANEIEIRVAHPDRLTSMVVPPLAEAEERPREWRVAPKLDRSLLRGFVNGAVSRAFQAPLRDHRPNQAKDEEDFVEFREEMAEMPLNMLVPSLFVGEAERNLEQVIAKLPKTFSNDKDKVMKLLMQGQRGVYEVTPKDDEALRRYDKAAADAAARARDRAADMRRTAMYYKDQWDVITTGKSLSDQRFSMRSASAPKAKPLPASPAATDNGSAQHPYVYRVAESDGGTELLLPPPPPAEAASETPGVFARQASLTGLPQAAAPELPPDEEELSEEREWARNRATGLHSLVSFRPSTSRKDPQLRFVPINLHLQVLAVREATVALRRDLSAPAAQPAKKGLVAKARQSIAQAFTLPSTSPKHPLALPSGPLVVRMDLGADAERQPRAESELGDAGMFASANGRRRGRQSIMGAVTGSMDESHAPPRTQTTGTLGNIDEDTQSAVPFWDDAEPHIFYETLSVGAPSAHGMSAKMGGLWTMKDDVARLKHEAERLKDEPPGPSAPLAARLDAYRKYHELRLLFAERMDIVIAQALTCVVSAIVARLFVLAATGGLEDEDDLAVALIQHGFLVGWESLLSTHGSEICMLADTRFAVRYISDNVVVRLELLPDDAEVQAVDVKLYRSNRPSPVGLLGPGGLDDVSTLVVAVRLPDRVVDELPRPLRTYIEDSTQCAVPESGVLDFDACKAKKVVPLAITCVLFTQGINEMQSLANLWGSQGSWQEDINKESCDLILQYTEKRFVREEDPKSEKAKKTRELTIFYMAKLRVAIKNAANVEKNYEILTTSADLVRFLNGVRICSCKSAKDRTAMSLTLEEARLLVTLHHITGQTLDTANIIREHGTRLINVNKNTGTPKYAFNMAQRKLLPEQYRPPMSVIGGFFRGNVT